MLDLVFETGKPLSMIWQIPPPDEMYWEVTRTPIVGKDGKLDAVLGTWHRITEEVMLRRKFESSEMETLGFLRLLLGIMAYLSSVGRPLRVIRR